MIPGSSVMLLILVAASLLLSFFARRATSTDDFYLGGRKLGIFTNASAICGDYFSAASFLGVAGAVYALGLDGLWFGTGFGAAFVPVLLFFASPLRRFGEYTLPDFLAARFQSRSARLGGVVLVQLIAFFYLAPQMVGAGSVWTLLVGHGFFGLSSYATGLVVATGVMVLYAGVGGMRGTTWNQMAQFWVLLSAMALVVGLGLWQGFHYSRDLAKVSLQPLTTPVTMPAASLQTSNPAAGRTILEDSRAVLSETYWQEHVAQHLNDGQGSVTVLLPQASKLTGKPMHFNEPGSMYGPLDQVSMVIALVLGTSGLPHIMNRFYTNPTGPVARWTTVWTLIFAAVFYALAAMVGVIGRSLVPVILPSVQDLPIPVTQVDGILTQSDLLLPVLGRGLGGPFSLGWVVAGAFAAMFSTIGGLLLASAASWAHDLYEQFGGARAPEWKKVLVGRASVVGMALVALWVGLAVPSTGLLKAYPAVIALMVTWAFSIAGGGMVPAMFMSIWWKRTTLRGVLSGMLVGGGGSVFIILCSIFRKMGYLPPDSFLGRLGLLTFPSLLTVPAAVLTIYIVSRLDQKNLPTNIDEIWARIHGTARERAERRLAELVRSR